MSGVRIKNRALLESGMTLPGFVERSNVIASLPNLGLLTLAAYTPKHWDITYIDIDQIETDLVDSIINEGYDLVGISFLTARAYETYELADAIRAEGLVVVLGGLHTSALPEEASQHANAIVIGEAEPVWPQLLEDYEKNCLQKSYHKAKAEITGFTDGPVPRYDLLDISRYNRITLQTTRGCPLHCEFCGASHLISPTRRKSIPQVRCELEAILEQWNKPFIELADDNTFIHKKWGKELLQLFSEYPIRWFTETDISVANDPELLDLLAASGCAQVLIGLESPNQRTLSEMDPAGWKARQHNQVAESVKRIQEMGISVNGCFILGSDTDDASCFDTTLEAIDSLELSEAQITLLTPFPGTALFDRLKLENRLLKGSFWDQCTLFDVCFEPKKMSVDELETGFHDLMRKVYSEERVARRKHLFRQQARKRFTQ